MPYGLHRQHFRYEEWKLWESFFLLLLKRFVAMLQMPSLLLSSPYFTTSNTNTNLLPKTHSSPPSLVPHSYAITNDHHLQLATMTSIREKLRRHTVAMPGNYDHNHHHKKGHRGQNDAVVSIHGAAAVGDVAHMRKLIQGGATINDLDQSNKTVLRILWH